MPLSTLPMLAKPPNRKRALEYLEASGAVPITIIERDGVCTIHAGGKSETVSDIISTVWLAEQDAARVAREARRLAGDSPDASQATAALARSAALLGVTLTPADVAIARASAAVTRLDAMIEAMRWDGTLQQFNTRYKAGRAAAAVRSELPVIRQERHSQSRNPQSAFLQDSFRGLPPGP